MAAAVGNDALTVYVGGVSYDAKEDQIHSFFEKCGEIASIRMPKFKDSGRCKGIAFVEFTDKAGVDAALQQNDAELLGRHIKVNVARPRVESNNAEAGGERGRGRGRGGRRGRGRGRGGRNRSPRADRGPSPPSETIFIGNLAWAATEDDLREHFKDSGTIENVRIPTDRNSGRQKGFAYVTFDTVAAAEKAVLKSGEEIQGRQVRVDFAAQKTKPVQ